MDSYVYLDYAASAPMVPEAKAAEAAYAEAPYAGANPNSLHTLGREAAMALEGARREIAKALGGGFRPGEIVFTSGGTESNNLALYGIAEGARARDRKRTRVVVSAIEHDSELDVVSALKDRGFAVTLVRPGRDGRIAPEELERAVGPDCALVSIMSANNETGVIQPVAELAEIAHKAGALMHTDAVQAFGRIPLAIDTCDAVSIAAHKIGGPVGIGALALRMRCPFRPQNFGGGQEAGKRPGTQDVRGALAFAAAAKAQTDHLAERRSACAAKANRLFQKICAPGTGIQPSTTAQIDDTRLPGMVSIYVPGLDSETLILKLDQKGFEVSAGSACSSGSLDPSHVLSAMGIARNDALGALRISFDERVSDEDLDRFADALIGIVAANN
ncbi:MAG: cysteine desulfurase family protein [Atopobiaceae bacterium]|nr:cysteine desulfurase family protein [Atopobiaceae bacterium]